MHRSKSLVKKDIMNLGALVSIQGANALAPLIIFPYVLQMIGSRGYAELVLAESVSLLVLAVVVYSFDVVGVASLAALKAENNLEKISHLFSAILYLRLLLWFAAAVVALVFHHLVFHGSWVVMALWTLVPLAYVFQSTWLFQGFERNVQPAVVAVISRLTCIVFILWLIRNPSDKLLVPAIMGGFYLAGGVASLGYAVYGVGIRFRAVTYQQLWKMLHDGKEIFLGNISISLSRDFNVLILGLVGIPAHALSAYSIAEKVTKCVQAVARPLNQLFFPKTVRAIKDDKEPSRTVARKILRHTVPQVSVLAVVLVALLASYVWTSRYTTYMTRLSGSEEIQSYLLIMIPSIFFGIFNFMFGSVGLNYLNCRIYFFRAILFVGILCSSVCFILSHWVGAYAAAFCYLGSEVLIASLIAQRFVFNFRFFTR